MRDVTAFVLAGGKSTRMGADKAFLELEGRTLLAWALERVRAFAPNVRVVGEASRFASFAPVVEDIFSNHGPLGGIHAALRSSATDLNLMLAVDLPFVPADFLQYLADQAVLSPTAAAVVPRASGGWQPLCAVYRREFAQAAENALRAGRNKIDAVFDLLETRAIEEDELVRAGFSPAIFRNLNTPEDLDAARQDR